MSSIALVKTIKERCRTCYTCVRGCPAKAIRIAGGQAEVITERCVGCGNCVKVCSQNAKEVVDGIKQTKELLNSNHKVAAMIAPSFPAEFDEFEYHTLVGMIKKLGFTYVNEVAFGADLVAHAYKRLLNDNPDKHYIATTCPAVVTFVQYYYPNLVKYLTPLISPMVATARALKKIHGDDLKVVFIGPCIAKKGETEEMSSADSMDGVITFDELRQFFSQEEITSEDIKSSNFDPPYPGKGVLLPLARGLLEAAELREDLIEGDIVATDGQANFIEAIKEFEKGALNARLLEVLSCNGCIMGAGVTKKEKPLFKRRAHISTYAQQRIKETSGHYDSWQFETLDLTRTYKKQDRRIPAPKERDINAILNKMGKFKSEDELNCGACGYETCRDHAIAILKGLAESEMCLPYTIDQLKVTVQKLADSNEEVASIQSALVHSEKLASMGQLAAGVAHEVNNPLGIVLMYAHLLLEKYQEDSKLADDLSMIVKQADRCKRIVSGLLNFARQNKTTCQASNVMEIIRETVKSVSLSEGIEVKIEDSLKDPIAEIDRDQIAQALVNLYTNAEAAMPKGGELVIRAGDTAEKIIIEVSDTGVGIPEENRTKIFEPFFTTKQIGRGTGLGLAVLYGIIKMHRGSVTFESNNNRKKGPTGTKFIISLPRKEINTATVIATNNGSSAGIKNVELLGA